MHKVSETTDKKSMSDPAPFGPGFPSSEIDRAVRMEVWGTKFDNPGPDYCEFRLFDAEGRKIASRRVDGY
jgi:hypothetical protein